MEYQLLSIRDTKAEIFMTPFTVPTLAVAFRDIAAEIARGGDANQLSLFTKDFELWQLGTFDSETGLLDASSDGQDFPAKVCDCTALTIPRE